MKKAFTLIELLVVVLIIGILSAIALPQYQRAVEKARTAEVLQNVGALQRAVDMYLLENNYPTQTVTFIGQQTNGTLDIDVTQNLTCTEISECSNKYFAYGASCTATKCEVYSCRTDGRCDDYDYLLQLEKPKSTGVWTKECLYNTGKEYICKGMESLGFSSRAC